MVHLYIITVKKDKLHDNYSFDAHLIHAEPNYQVSLLCRIVSIGSISISNVKDCCNVKDYVTPSLRTIHFHYSFQLFIIHLGLRSPTWLIFKIKTFTRTEILKSSTYCAFISYILANHVVWSFLSCIVSTTELIFENNTNFSIVHLKKRWLPLQWNKN